MGQCLHFMQEVRKLACQLHRSFSLNLKSSRPFRLHLTGLATGGRLHQAFRKWSPGYENYMVSEAHSFFPSSLLSFLSFLPSFLSSSLPASLPLPPTFCFLPKPSLISRPSTSPWKQDQHGWVTNLQSMHTVPTKLQSIQPTSVGGQGEKKEGREEGREGGRKGGRKGEKKGGRKKCSLPQ